MPETGDTDFSWSEFVRRNNDELVATYGNLVNRVLRFTYRNFDGQVPVDAAAPEDMEHGLLQTARETMTAVDESLAHTRFRAGVSQAFGLAQECNRYLDARAPWRAIKEDRAHAARSLATTIQVLNLPEGHARAVSSLHQPEAARVLGIRRGSVRRALGL